MCKHEKFIESLGKPQSNREYWIITEIFVYLHNGADSCNCQKTAHNSDYAKCKIEAEIKRLEENPEGDYITRISALEWALRIVEEVI